jgi:hypothetical protein
MLAKRLGVVVVSAPVAMRSLGCFTDAPRGVFLVSMLAVQTIPGSQRADRQSRFEGDPGDPI